MDKTSEPGLRITLATKLRRRLAAAEVVGVGSPSRMQSTSSVQSRLATSRNGRSPPQTLSSQRATTAGESNGRRRFSKATLWVLDSNERTFMGDEVRT
jgi:hypothetical protein